MTLRGWCRMKYLKLGKICDILNGYAFKSSKYTKTGYRVIRITNVQKGVIVDEAPQYYSDKDMIDLKKYELFENDILMSLTGNVGRVGIMDKSLLPAALNQRVACLRLKNQDIYYKYLFYYLNSDRFENMCIENSNGIAQKNLSTVFLKNVLIPVPLLDIQKKIVEVLDKAQELIDARKEQIRLMDELIQSVFYEMFGDPVANPKGWEVGTINDLTLKTQYGTSKKAHETNGEYPVLRMNNITYSGGWDFSSLKYVDLDENELEKYLVYEGELLFNRTNSKELVGKSAVYRKSKPMAYAGYLVKLKTNPKGNAEYISSYLNSKHGKATLLNMAKSIVGMANINAEELKKIKINLPSVEKQNEFAKIVRIIEDLKDVMHGSLENYEMEYQAIMQKAFNGKLF